MFTPTIFLPEVDSNKEMVTLEDSKVHHLKNVLRIKDYENVNISNGVGELLLGRFVKDHVEINSQKNIPEKMKFLYLFLSSGKKTDLDL